MFVAARIKQARELRGWTQTELADQTGVTQAAIARIEAGLLHPSSDFVTRAALALGFPLVFFRTDPLEVPLGSLLFRASKRLSARHQVSARRWGEVSLEAYQRLASEVELPPIRLPRFAGLPDPREAAQATRAALGIPPDTPIKNLVRAVERGGVIVLDLPVPAEQKEAFSFWHGDAPEMPVIALFQQGSGDRLRFSVAHELGHLVMPGTFSDDPEAKANAFASEFLLPASAIRQSVTTPVTLSDLAGLKPIWGTSVQALVMRCRSLGLLSERQYRYLFERIGKLGWRRREPAELDVPVERPRAFRQMAEMLYGEPIDTRRLAARLGLAPSFVGEMLGEQHQSRRRSDGDRPRVGRPVDLESFRS